VAGAGARRGVWLFCIRHSGVLLKKRLPVYLREMQRALSMAFAFRKCQEHTR